MDNRFLNEPDLFALISVGVRDVTGEYFCKQFVRSGLQNELMFHGVDHMPIALVALWVM